ncbi:MAG: glycosyltransferase [Hyphomicrobiales bacterium]|nr:glycosyltransferase [Hyphomicrobiales bacterium]MBV9111396.1 glycosyltransferase [Hyphomicrobiales bacterium]
MRVTYFAHSLLSCWNHGNAHFLRGVLRALIRKGNEVAAFEPTSAWSLAHLLADHGQGGLAPYLAAYPELCSNQYGADLDLAAVLADQDLVIVHEWNEPWLVAAIGRLRKRGARFTLLFHDTHHRAVSDPEAIRHFDLDGYDGVLAFGEALARIYRRWGWGDRVFVWHEAADTSLFHPPVEDEEREGLVWIGNWGDGERTEELAAFLLRPARRAGLSLDIHGVRYPQAALETLSRHGARYRDWLPNVLAPGAFSRHIATVHVPRHFYVEALPGIPTIRVFEALACGIPLLSAPWHDTEGLFRVGEDYLLARTEAEMCAHMRAVAQDRDLAASLVANGLMTIRERHSCAHRAQELIAIISRLRSETRLEVAR